jgi:hypothetical protein
MAVATAFQSIQAENQVTAYDFDPNSTNATDVAWVDMRDFDSILIGFFRTIGVSDLTFAVLANDVSNGSGTDVTVKSVTLAAQPNAVGDHVWTEVSASEIRQACEVAGVNGRYVSASFAFGTNTDEGVGIYIRRALQKKLNLTTDVVA